MGTVRLYNLDTVMIDVVTHVAHLPSAGGDVRASASAVRTGGGFNVMSAAARQGMPVTYVGRLGHGTFSELARRDLDGLSVATPVAAHLEQDAGYCLVLVDESGERTFVTATGAELSLGAADLALVVPSDGDYVFVSGYCLVYPEIAEAVTHWVSELAEGVVVAFDPAPRVLDIAARVLDPMLARADWLLLNDTEAVELSGESELDDVLETLMTISGRSGVVVHRGELGCVVATRTGDVLDVPAFATDPVDTNGAGDTHDGVFLAELARGSDVASAAQRANAASALAVAQIGPATCPTREEITSFLARAARS